jgi:glyoxylase-like metal-dependent hydrolase (beta-lactamase superfamily II)
MVEVPGEACMNIHTLDLKFLGKSHTIASYLIEGPAGPVLVETGPASTLANLQAGLAEHGYRPADIHHILVSHIHLDHAGAAGWWAQQGAQIYVHPVGAPHLVDPTRLLASATRIYGEDMDRLWGQILPAPEDKVTPVQDGEIIKVAGLSFKAMDTPGHAYHHHVYQLGDIAFTGDAAGIRIPGINFVDLPAPPPEFNLELWQITIDRLLEQPFETIYPTHFGRLNSWRSQLERLKALLQEASEFVRSRMDTGLERKNILSDYMAWHRRRAEAVQMPQEIFEQYEAANPHFMSVDGLIRYWRKRSSG